MEKKLKENQKEKTLGEICVENNFCNSIRDEDIFYCDDKFIKSKEDCKYVEINNQGKKICGYYKQ